MGNILLILNCFHQTALDFLMELFNAKTLEQIGNYLKNKKETIAVAESVTSGALQLALSSVFEASFFYQGGLTAYNLGQKFKHLSVEPIHAASVNCVSEKVAGDMATGVAVLFGSDWGIGITGYASPVPESGNKIFAYYSFAYKNKIRDSGRIDLPQADPIDIQVTYTNKIVERLAVLL
jgi:nicotinamide-nucleotide amidase